MSALAATLLHSRARDDRGARALAWYLALVAAIAAIPLLAGGSYDAIAHAVAFSPDQLTSGHLWLLPLSGLVVDGDPWPQLVLLAATAVPLVMLAGGWAFWRAALGAHVGATLVAYGLVATLLLLAPGAVRGLPTASDFGTSCVWMGALGALAVVAARRYPAGWWRRATFLVLSLPAVALVASSGFVDRDGVLDLASVEHAAGFAIGVLAAWRGVQAMRWRKPEGWQETPYASSSRRTRKRRPASVASQASSAVSTPRGQSD